MYRYEISLFVPTGVYEHANEPGVEYGIFSLDYDSRKSERDQAFRVGMAQLATRMVEKIEIATMSSKPFSRPLIDIEGFLVPVVRDGYAGVRYQQVAELWTPVPAQH
jgi:hypothetical protein